MLVFLFVETRISERILSKDLLKLVPALCPTLRVSQYNLGRLTDQRLSTEGAFSDALRKFVGPIFED